MGTGLQMACVAPNLLPGHPWDGCCSGLAEVALGGRGAQGCSQAVLSSPGLAQCLDSLSVHINTGSA